MPVSNPFSGTQAVYFDRSNPTVAATFAGTLATYFDQSNPAVTVYALQGATKRALLGNTEGAIKVYDIVQGTVTANAGTGTLTIKTDPGYELGSIKGINSSVGVYFDRGNPSVTVYTLRGTTPTALIGNTDGAVKIYDIVQGTITANAGTGTLTVRTDPGYELGSIKGINSTVTVKFDPGYTLGKVDAGVGTFQVFLPDTGHELGTIRGNTNTLTVFLPDTGHTLGKVDAGAGTFNVKLDPGYTLGKVDQGVTGTIGNSWFVNTSSTAGIFTVSSSAAGVSVSGNTIISPSAAYNFKIYAFGLTSTAQSNIFVRFTNGAGTSPTEFARYALQAPTQGIAGANLAVTPPGYLFATGVNVTLALVIDAASLVHYWVSYLKESA